MSELKLTVTHWGTVALDKREMRALMRSAAATIQRKTATLINKTAGSGRLYGGGGGAQYRGQYKPGPYRASAPGDPPVRVTGTLRRSLKSFVYPSGEGFAVRERQFYALFLEAGARGGGNPGRASKFRRGKRVRAKGVYTARVLLPRPSLDRVMAEEARELDRRVGTAMTQGLRWKETK
jgi:hypothetical protein